MFGFLRAQTEELKVRDYNLVEAYYCGLCYTLGKQYGTLLKSLRNCDSNFYALLADAQLGTPPRFRKAVCPRRPYLRVRAVDGESSIMFSAGLAVVMFASNLQDKAEDEDGLRIRTGEYLVHLALDKAKQDLEANGFSFELILNEWQEQKDIEERECPGMELSARPTATVLSRVLEHTAVLGQAEENREICARIGYALGELIFLADHFLDYPEDIKRGRFNALAAEAKARGEPVTGNTPTESVRSRCQEICFDRMNRIKADAWVLKLKQHEEIIRNVLELGLPTRITHIFTCKDPNCKKPIHQPPTFAKFPFNLLGV